MYTIGARMPPQTENEGTVLAIKALSLFCLLHEFYVIICIKFNTYLKSSEATAALSCNFKEIKSSFNKRDFPVSGSPNTIVILGACSAASETK